MSEYTEYKTNLYTDAMGCVTNRTGSNVFDSAIPLAKVRERFALETVASYPTAYVIPGNGNGAAGRKVVEDKDSQTIVRVRDGRIHGRFGADVPRRQYEYLYDLATGVTGESLGDLKVTAAGTTRNGGRAYIQFSTAEILSVAGMDYAPFLTLGMGHDGSLSVTSATGISVIQCANMIAGIFGAGNLGMGTKVKQSKNATDAGIITRHAIALQIQQKADEFDAAVTTLSETLLTDEMWTAFLDELAPVNVEGASKNIETRNENMRGTLTGFWNSDPRVAPWRGTALGALQAVNTFDIWERGTRGETAAEVRMADDFLSGKLAARENEHGKALARVLARA